MNLAWLVDYLTDLRLWLPSLVAATTLTLYVQERRKKALEIEKLNEEIRRLKQEPSRLYSLTGKEVDEMTEKLRPFAARIQRFIGADTPFQEFAPRLNKFILAYASQAHPPDPEPILSDWNQVRGEAAERLGRAFAGDVDFFLKMAVRGKQFKSAVPVDLDGYRTRNEQLAEAVRNGREDQVASLLDQGANPDGNAGAEETPIVTAARSGHAAIAVALLAAGADPNSRAGQHRTPLIAAAREGNVTVVRSLVGSAKTNINAIDQAGLTALMHAVNGKHEDVVRLLLEARADATIKDENHQTALSRAIKSKHAAIEAMLRNAGATA